MNDVSSWIDGSVIYGNDVGRLNMLRTLKNGSMIVDAETIAP